MNQSVTSCHGDQQRSNRMLIGQSPMNGVPPLQLCKNYMDQFIRFSYLSHMPGHTQNMHAHLSNGAGGLKFSLCLFLCPYIVCARRESLSKTACKYQNLMNWLMYVICHRARYKRQLVPGNILAAQCLLSSGAFNKLVKKGQ